MSIISRVYRYFPQSFKDDFFSYNYYNNNSLNHYAIRLYKYQKLAAHRIYYPIHLFAKYLVIFVSFLDRKTAKLAYKEMEREFSNIPEVTKNKKLEGIHSGKRCFIIANGASINKQDLTPLANEYTIVINSFWKHPILKKWQPTYYLMGHTDGFYPREKAKKGFEEYTDGEVREYFTNIKKNIPDSIYFIPLHGLKGNKEQKFLPLDKTYYLPIFPFPVFEFLPGMPSLTHGMPWAQDSSQYAIMMAMSMGFKEIILLGCDHDWYVNPGEEKHFFQGATMSKEGEKFNSAKIPMMQNMWFAYVLWKGHYAIDNLAKKHGITIINASAGGVLDVYNRKKFEDVLGR